MWTRISTVTLSTVTLFVAMCGALSPTSAAEAIDLAQLEFFESHVRPLLAEHCFECHAKGVETIEAELRVDTLASLLQGGDSGPAVIPGNADASLLIQAVRWQEVEMPPDGKLKDEQIATLVRWVEMGAPWPKGEAVDDSPQKAKEYDWPKLRAEHWAWRPVDNAEPPTVKAALWVQNPIDQFVLARLENARLSPAEPAQPRVLLRRIYFDLIGLPPTSEQVDQFLTAAKTDRGAAIGNVIDQLLESPHYGERWGRHWLDVARYSDGFGGFNDNRAMPHAWRYRDWVVGALNQDMPYDQFVRLQIAGDLIGTPQDAIATGFLALGPTYNSDGGDPDSVAQAKSETLDDRIDTIGRGILGLTIACSRCHDHKFDPIPQQDYYSLAGVFNNTTITDLPLSSAVEVNAYNDLQRRIKDLNNDIRRVQDLAKKEKRDPSDDEQKQLTEHRQQLEELKKEVRPKYAEAHTIRDTGEADMAIAIRGNLRKPGDVVPRRFPRILAGEASALFTRGSGRLDLAESVMSSDNPITSRVIANRIWMHHFGKPLVGTPNNFGLLGSKPTHPELLDWLSATLVKSDWSLKQLHRLIMASATYQMSSHHDAGAFAIDGANRLLWRMNPRRMDVESWRDALLAVTGELDTTFGGPPVDNLTSSRRRTLYAKVSRAGDRFSSDTFLRMFDFPLMRASVARRTTSIVPQQFLFLMNSPFMVQRARTLVSRIHNETESDKDQIDRAYRLLFSRSPSAQESQIGLEFLATKPDESNSLSAWHQYAQVLLSSNEFMYLR